MQYDPKGSRKSQTISTSAGDLTWETKVEIPQPFVEGHVMTAGEASTMNQTVAETVSNRFRQQAREALDAVSKGKEGATPPTTDIQQSVDDFVSSYEFGVSRVTDPIDQEVRDIAEKTVLEVLRQKGKSKSEVNFTELRDKYIAKEYNNLRKQAVANVEKRSKIAAEILDL